MLTRILAALAGLIVVGTLSGCSSQPNVLLIVLDTVRQHNVSSYGYERPTTPHLDQFARGALVFDNAFAVGPWTTPNHASMFTGLYTIQHGASQESRLLRDELVTLAEVLSDDGYETAAFVNNPTISRARGFAQGFEHFEAVWRKDVRARLSRTNPIEGPDEGSRHTARAVRTFFEDRARPDRPDRPDRPYFVFINYREAHAPYTPSPRHLGEFAGGRKVFERKLVAYDYGKYLSGRYQMSEADFAVSMSLYDGEIRLLDERVGSLLGWLESSGYLDDTLVIITSDHGEEFGEHDLVGHQFALYNTLLRVPLIVRFPGESPPVGRSQRRTQLLDLFPTILETTGSPLPDSATLRGRSLLEKSGHELLFAEYYRPIGKLREFNDAYPDFDTTRYDRRIRSLSRGDDKFIWSSDGRHELYDLSNDPAESKNLAASQPERLAEMAALLEEFLAAVPGKADTDAVLPPKITDPELLESLRALGYAE